MRPVIRRDGTKESLVEDGANGKQMLQTILRQTQLQVHKNCTYFGSTPPNVKQETL